MKRIYFSIPLLLLLIRQADAQDQRQHMIDSIKRVYKTEAALRNPALRQVVLSTNIIGKGQIRSKLYGKEIFEGEMSQVQSEALFNIPVASWGRNGIATQIDVIQQHMRLSDVKAYEPIPDLNGKTADKITVGVTVSYQRVDSLFRRPVYYSGNITGYTGQDGSVEKMRFLGVGILTLKQTPVNSFSLGMIVIVDPTSNIPAIPMVIYTHRFNKGLELNVSLPQQVSLRQALSRNCWASFGTVISAPSAFFRYNSPEVPHDVNYTTVNLKTGPSVEYRFGKYFIAGINAGLWTPIQSRQFEHWTRSTNYFLDNKIETTPYVNFSLSVLPFF